MTSKGRYEDFATKYLNVGIRTGNEWMVRCLWHDDSKASLQFNVDSGLWVCFACTEKGNIRKMLAKFGISHIEEMLNLDDVFAKLDAIERGNPTIERVLPDSYLDRYALTVDYWKERGFTDDTIKRFELGGDLMDDVATIPLRDVDGQLLGVIRRFNDPDEDTKYKNPKHFHRQDHLFASWLYKDVDTTTAVLVEGPTDAMMCWQADRPALGQFGSTISRNQIKLLLRLGVENVVLFYDNPLVDKTGEQVYRYAQGWHRTLDRKTKQSIYEYDETTDLAKLFTVSIAQYPAKPKRKDACALGAVSLDLVQNAIDKAVRLT